MGASCCSGVSPGSCVAAPRSSGSADGCGESVVAVAWMCTSLMTCDAETLFTRLLATRVSSSARCPFRSFFLSFITGNVDSAEMQLAKSKLWQSMKDKRPSFSTDKTARRSGEEKGGREQRPPFALVPELLNPVHTRGREAHAVTARGDCDRSSAVAASGEGRGGGRCLRPLFILEGQPFPGSPTCDSGRTGTLARRGQVTAKARWLSRAVRLVAGARGGAGFRAGAPVSGTRGRGLSRGQSAGWVHTAAPAGDRLLTREGARGCVHTKPLTACLPRGVAASPKLLLES